jgi:hypothetical protein
MARFSEIAASSVRAVHADETRRDVHLRPPFRTVFCRRLASQAAEQATERAETLEADLIADLGYRIHRGHEQFFGTIEASITQILMRRGAVYRSKRADEMKSGEPGEIRETIDGQRFLVVTIDVLADPFERRRDGRASGRRHAELLFQLVVNDVCVGLRALKIVIGELGVRFELCDRLVRRLAGLGRR